MSQEDQLLYEHEMLREELIMADNQNYQVLTTASAGIVLMFSVAVTLNDPFVRPLIFLATYLVTFLAYRILFGNRRRIWRISTYLRVFTEKQLQEVKWETRINRQRELREPNNRLSFSSLIIKNEYALLTLFNCAACVAAIFDSIINRDKTNIHFITLIVSNAIVWGLILLNWMRMYDKRIERLGEEERSILAGWNLVLEEERKSSDNKKK